VDAQALKTELLAMAAEDLRVRDELARDGSLYEGYHRRMRDVHDRNAERLGAILEQHGWPGCSLVGREGAEAAWLVLQHAIAHPDLQRRGLVLLVEAAARGDVPRSRVAYLEDRILCNEGKRQRYGTQFDWDRHGELNPLPIEDEANVDARRSEIGLEPLSEVSARMRVAAAQSGERAPRDWSAREREKEQWARSTGWRD
jgi:Family of unknown function (DUF6624)